MTLIRIEERGRDPDGSFRARVSFGDDASYDVTVSDPADQAVEDNLAWYFEQHPRHPFLDTGRERDAVRQLAGYGEALFRQVFGGEASHAYRTLRDRSFGGCRLEVLGPAALHRLHWEALRDPDYRDLPLAVWLPVTRRVEAQPLRFELPGPQPTLNILLVAARPGGPRDVGYRTISRPLLEALRTVSLPVTVDLVRPGTWDALRAHLQRATQDHGPGWYQVIHFDLYGAVTGYATLAAGQQAGRLHFSPGPVAPFEGQRGLLFFETGRDGVAHPVPAENVASLLAEHRVPVAVLNACQSAQQTTSGAGLAQRLAEAGVPVSVGMAYSVTVSAAEQAMPVLYRRLAGGEDPVLAVHGARRYLFERRGRRAYFDQRIDLEDWLLPVVFGQRPLQVRLRDMTGGEQARFYERSAAAASEPGTEYGFVGRDLDVQAIERRLLAGQHGNELLVQGMAGAGKSTLLAHLAWWWQRTGLVDQVFSFTYERRAWTSGQIVRDIRAKLFGPADDTRAGATPEAAQLEQVAQRLRAQRHLLILDNAESITAAPAAIPHALSPGEQRQLKTLLASLRGGRTLVLLGSREQEDWLTADGTGPGIYPLPGLDPQAASVLADRILTGHGAAGYLRDETQLRALDELVTLLGGYPLPLTVVLPALAAAAPSTVLAELRAGAPGADPAGLIHRAAEYSHGKLDPALQNSLLLLAPFAAAIGTGPRLDRYAELLLADEAVRGLGPVDLAAAIGQAVSVGLAAPDPELGMVRLQPVLPYFLRSRLHDRPAIRAATDDAHYQLYCEFCVPLGQLLRSPSDPQARALGQALAGAEYANLTAALGHGLRTGRPVGPVVEVLGDYLDQAQQHDTRRQLITDAIAAHRDPGSDTQRWELAQLHSFAGRTALAQRRFGDAKSHYGNALTLLRAMGDRRAQGVIYHQLGSVAQEERNYPEAEENYRTALGLSRASGDRHCAALTCHQLGIVAQEQQRYGEAQDHYRTALGICLESGDRHRAAAAYCQLGSVAEDQRRYREAQLYYRKALDICLESGDRPGAATIHHHLGAAAQGQQRYGEARDHYRAAIGICLESGDRHGAASAYYQLGVLARRQRRFDEAQANCRKALDICLELGDRRGTASACHELGSCALERGQYEEAEAGFRQALEIYLESGDHRHASAVAAPLGTLLAGLGRHGEAARAVLPAAVGWRRETGQWPREGLRWLDRERALIGAGELAALVAAYVPGDLAGELVTAIGAAGDPVR